MRALLLTRRSLQPGTPTASSAATVGAVGLGRHATLARLRADLLGIHLTPSRLVRCYVSVEGYALTTSTIPNLEIRG